MTDRLLVDLSADGRVSVSTLLDGEISANPVGEPFELAWPLDADAMEDLRWYLEDYLRAPFVAARHFVASGSGENAEGTTE